MVHFWEQDLRHLQLFRLVAIGIYDEGYDEEKRGEHPAECAVIPNPSDVLHAAPQPLQKVDAVRHHPEAGNEKEVVEKDGKR